MKKKGRGTKIANLNGVFYPIRNVSPRFFKRRGERGIYLKPSGFFKGSRVRGNGRGNDSGGD